MVREREESKVLREKKNSCSVHNDRFHHHHYHSFRMYLYDNKKVRRVYKEVREEKSFSVHVCQRQHLLVKNGVVVVEQVVNAISRIAYKTTWKRRGKTELWSK